VIYYVYAPKGKQSQRSIRRLTHSLSGMEEARRTAEEECKASGNTCIVSGAFPKGMCIEAVWGGKAHGVTFSRPRLNSAEARDDAMAQCKRGGSSCEFIKAQSGGDWHLCNG